MRVYSANCLRALVLIPEIAAAEKGWSRKARHWPAPDRSKGFAACFGNGRFLGKTSNRHFLAKSSRLWFSFSEATRANGPEGGVACPVESQLSSSRPESTFNPLRNLHSRKEKAFGFCCAGTWIWLRRAWNLVSPAWILVSPAWKPILARLAALREAHVFICEGRK